MLVGQVCAQAIRLKRMLDCPGHEWVRLNDDEDQCRRCGVIATEEGKRNLLRMARRDPHRI